MMPNRDRLHIQHITAGYQKKMVVNDISIPPLKAGTLAVVIGPNASGKSTLLRAIAGIIKAKGTVKLGERDLISMPVQKRASCVSFMPQQIPRDVSLSVIESVISALKASPFYGDIPTTSVHERALLALEEVGISHLAFEPLNVLSEGQRQLASLSRALARNPELLLLDEPTSALDIQYQLKVMNRIKTFAGDGRIVIAILHDLNLAMRFADQLMILQKGSIVTAGPPKTILTPEVLASVYGIQARIEPCSQGQLQVIIDDIF